MQKKVSKHKNLKINNSIQAQNTQKTNKKSTSNTIWRCLYCNQEYTRLPKNNEYECTKSPDGQHEIHIIGEES